MTATARSIVIDDSDPSIVYSGTWVVNQGKDFDSVGTNGRVFGASVHAASAAASLAYTFEGTAGQIMGTSMINNQSNTLNPTWTCSIDGTQIQTEPITLDRNNNWPFCRWSGLSEGSHTVTLNISSNGIPFYFDWLSFVPSSARIRPMGTSETILIPSSDPAITFDSSWTNLPDPLIGKATSQSGGSVTVSFSGTSIVWYAVAPSGTAIAPSKGRIRVDDRDTYPFGIPGLTSSASPSLFNQQYFQVANLSQGAHTLTVFYDGDSSMMPLTLSSVVVTDPPIQQSAKKPPIGIIVGGVVGGVVLIAFIVLAVWYLMRKPEKPKKPRRVEPENIIQPFNIPPTTGPQSTTPSLRTVRSNNTRQMTQTDSRGPLSTVSTSLSTGSGSTPLPGNASFTSSVPSSQALLSPSSRDRKTPVSATRPRHRPQQPSTTETNVTSSSTSPSTANSGGERRRVDSQRRRHQIQSTISEMPPAYTPG
ncbi:hypothetical protein CVT24_004186 [Panaeolus cyanescens]|uniref:Transmembrane protein n=1 Tax=Panaeolus cyanescens TaxID=181874 RepID=A0A409W7V6_9AGAR|nr:hypothetical protein CVT24_004186 [Panaeolus cyanescens]